MLMRGPNLIRNDALATITHNHPTHRIIIIQIIPTPMDID